MKTGDILFCRVDTDVLIANRIYQVTKIETIPDCSCLQHELDFDENLHFFPSEISELFSNAKNEIKALKIRMFNKNIKEKLHQLLPYIYFDYRTEKFFISKEFVDIFEDTNDHKFVIRVMYIILELMNDMDEEQINFFYEMEWDDLWNKIGEIMKETTDVDNK